MRRSLVTCLNRLLMAVPMAVGVTIVAFVLMRMAPGDPLLMSLESRINVGDQMRIRHQMGLDAPLTTQYIRWVSRVVVGDWGTSIVTRQPVIQVVAERVGPTVLLMGVSICLMLMLSVILGIMSGFWPHGWIDRLVAGFSILGYSLPSFWVGLMLIQRFSVGLNWLPTSGMHDPMIQNVLWTAVGDVAWHMVLPILTMAIGGVAGLIRYNRAAMLSVMSAPYMVAARARGFSTIRIMAHGFRNAVIPIVTLSGLLLPELFGGAYVIEHVFGWPGMGQLSVSAVFSRDYPVLMGILVMTFGLIVAGNLLSDLLNTMLDPRIREGT